MTIQKVYEQYKIMPTLQMHMLRVAGVGKIILNQFIQNPQEIVTSSDGSPTTRDDDYNNIITALLLHDMGNIIKFNLSLFPQFLEPEGINYWEKVKTDYIQRYGHDEHQATIEIARELLSPTPNPFEEGIDSNRVLDLIDAISFSKAEENFLSDDYGRKICTYSDMRVEPHGVTSLEKRLTDGRKRFKLNKKEESSEEFFNRMSKSLKKIEDQLFQTIEINPDDITEEKVKEEISSLRTNLLYTP